MSENTCWLNSDRCAVCLTFDCDAEYVFMGNRPEVAEIPRMKSLGEYERQFTNASSTYSTNTG